MQQTPLQPTGTATRRRHSCWLFVLAALACAPLMAVAQTAPAAVDSATQVPDRPRTCLVLGGGGARGAAHIGVLKVLERERVPIDCIVGTSMGAVVGGLYASGYTADEIKAVLDRIDWAEVLRDKPPRDERSMRRKEDDLRLLGGVEVGLSNGKIAFPQGLIQGQKLEMLLRRLLLPTWQVRDFDHLPIPFRAIATDIVSGEKVVFAQGDLALAIRASMSVPGVFAPVRYEDHLLVDGGVVDNVPIDEARRLGAQRLIVAGRLAADDRGAAGFTLGDQPPDGQRADAARSTGAVGHARPAGSADHTAAGRYGQPGFQPLAAGSRRR